MIYAIVDIGSNTVKMTVYNEKNEVLFTKSKTLKLLSYIENRIMSSEGITALSDCLKTYKEYAEEYNADIFAAFATASMRGLTNITEIKDEIMAKNLVEIDVVTGKEEALYSFEGNDNNGSGIYADMGGGSTELVVFKDGTPTQFTSLPFGSLSVSRKFHFNKNLLAEVENYVFSLCDINLPSDEEFDTLSIAGGSIKALATLYCKYNKIDCNEEYPIIKVKEFEVFYNNVKNDKDTFDILVQKYAPDRADLVLPACAALLALSKYYKSDRVLIKTKGIREGYLKAIKSDRGKQK